ncbi:MAG TPA: hypothetical protein VHN12_13850 [Geobacteraceae bacterium]|nr:hypothetical protein [Geobacteraceae bacterium]
MEIFGVVFGGLMVMLFIFGFFLVALWFILPFVIFAMKGKLDRSHMLLENIDRRLAAIEKELRSADHPSQDAGAKAEETDAPPS